MDDKDIFMHQFVHALTIGNVHNPAHLHAWIKRIGLRELPNLAVSIRIGARAQQRDWVLQRGRSGLWLSDRLKAGLRSEFASQLTEQCLNQGWSSVLWNWYEEMELIVLLTQPKIITKDDATEAVGGILNLVSLPFDTELHAGISRTVDNAAVLSAAIRSARQAALQAQEEQKGLLHADDMEVFEGMDMVGTVVVAPETPAAAIGRPLEAEIHLVRSLLQDIAKVAEKEGLDALKRRVLEQLVTLINSCRAAGVPVDDEEMSGTRLFESLLKATTWNHFNSWRETNGLVFLSKLSHLADQSRSHIIQEAISYVTAHLQEDLSLEEISLHCNVSHYYLSHLFRKETGTTVTAFVKKARIDRAMALLRDPRLTIAEVAYAVGYQDPNYFSKSFRSYVGVSPTEFRSL